MELSLVEMMGDLLNDEGTGADDSISATDDSDEASYCDSEAGSSTESYYSADEADSMCSNESESFDELYGNDVTDSRYRAFGDAIKLPEPTHKNCQPQNMFTCAKILGVTEYSILTCKDLSKDKPEDYNGVADNASGLPDSNAALLQALRLVNHLIANNSVMISAGKDDTIAIYDLARGFNLDTTTFRQGWARRSLLHGELYGEKNMTPEFAEQIYEMVMKGVRNKSHKMSPRQMYSELRQKSGRYTSPSEQEIRVKVSEILKEIKDGTKKKAAKKKATKKKKVSYTPLLEKAMEVITVAMKLKLRQKGWEDMMPKDTIFHLVMEKKVAGKLSRKDYETIRTALATKFSGLKSAKKKKRKDMGLRAIV